MADFEEAGRANAEGGIASEFWHFLKQSKKWWLLPIVVVVLFLGVLVALSSTAVAPFVYTLF